MQDPEIVTLFEFASLCDCDEYAIQKIGYMGYRMKTVYSP
jgi:hypothetical protein